MDPNPRKAWTEVVIGEDLDQHLAAIGQAQANAALFVEMLSSSGLPVDAELLLAGAGTGQLFDYADLDVLARYRLTCTDINEKFLAALEARLAAAPRLRASVHVDDLEATRLKSAFAAVAAILLLEHIDWQRGASALAGYAPTWIFLIIQRNDAAPDVLTPRRELAPSIRAAGEIARATLVREDDLTAFFDPLGYAIDRRSERAVPDDKVMIGLTYRRFRAL
jgi:methyltransferase family protein